MTIPEKVYEEFAKQINEIHDALQGKMGQIGLVAEVKEMRVEQQNQRKLIEEHLTAHQKNDDTKDSRTWRVFEMFFAAMLGAAITVILVQWGVK